MKAKAGQDVLTPKGVWASDDPAEFYRVTANYIAELSKARWTVHFQDTELGWFSTSFEV